MITGTFVWEKKIYKGAPNPTCQSSATVSRKVQEGGMGVSNLHRWEVRGGGSTMDVWVPIAQWEGKKFPLSVQTWIVNCYSPTLQRTDADFEVQ